MFLFQGRGKPAQRPAAADMLRSLIGGGLSVYMLLALTEYSGHMWIMAPFGASCVLLYAAPQSPLAQPRNIILGHLVSAFVGLCFAHWLPVNMFSISLAVGLAIACMQFLGCVHPPAGANRAVWLELSAVSGLGGRSEPGCGGLCGQSYCAFGAAAGEAPSALIRPAEGGKRLRA